MAVFVGRHSNDAWDNFEAEQDCLADIQEAFDKSGSILVDILRTRRGEPGERIITGRKPMILTARHFTAIENATLRFVEIEP